MIENFPLNWPTFWSRTPSNKRKDAAFRKSGSGMPHSVSEGTTFVMMELQRLGARSVVISSNMQYRKDGVPYSRQVRLDDPGVAVYFDLAGQARVLACDRWRLVEDNLWAIGLHIESIRGQERWGVGTVEQAFSGYVALPAPVTDWWTALGVDQFAGRAQVEQMYLYLAKRTHPDTGVNHEAFLKVQQAWDQAKEERGWT
jgi:hypothetical protein